MESLKYLSKKVENILRFLVHFSLIFITNIRYFSLKLVAFFVFLDGPNPAYLTGRIYENVFFPPNFLTNFGHNTEFNLDPKSGKAA